MLVHKTRHVLFLKRTTKDLLIVEMKSAKLYHTQMEMAKLEFQIQLMLNTLIEENFANTERYDILLLGFECQTFKMYLMYDKAYRMI